MSVGSLYGEPHRKDPQVVREREEALTAPRALLLRRAELIRVRAEHAAVTLPRPEHGSAARTCVEVLTGVLGHRLAPRRSAFRTRDRRLCDDPWDRSAAPLGAAGRSAAVRRPLRRRPAAAVRLPRSRSGERECRKPRGIRSLNDPSVVNSEGGGGQKSRASVVPLPRRAGPRCSPSRVARLTLKMPYLARPGSRAAHGLLNNYDVRVLRGDWAASRHAPTGSRRRRVTVDMKRSGGTGTNIDWTAGGPEAEAALNRCLRLASAREAGVRDEELTRVLRELMGGAVLAEEA
jgi:hypothetical protein